MLQMKLAVVQKPERGVLGGPVVTTFSMSYEGIDYKIAIEQHGERQITIESSTNGSLQELLGMFYSLEALLMLFDGQFYPIIIASDDTGDITQSIKKRALPSRFSADFMRHTHNSLVKFYAVLNAHIFIQWLALQAELDLIHKMVLYCVSSVQIPKDIQCAFMVEAFNGIYDLAHEKDSSIQIPAVQKGESRLQKCLLLLMHRYGRGVFYEELQADSCKFTQILVDTRNKIGHIKSKQNRVYLDGSECVMYLLKLSLLYRIVLFEILGIDKKQYEEKLTSWVHIINSRKETLDFLEKLAN